MEWNAGSINIQATEQVSLDGIDKSDTYPSGVFSEVDSGGVGNGGNIDVTTKSTIRHQWCCTEY